VNGTDVKICEPSSRGRLSTLGVSKPREGGVRAVQAGNASSVLKAGQKLGDTQHWFFDGLVTSGLASQARQIYRGKRRHCGGKWG